MIRSLPSVSKAALRNEAGRIRAEAAARLGAAAGQALAAAAAALAVPPDWVVAGYWPIGDEIDPLPLLRTLAESGCPLALPAVAGQGQPLGFRSWKFGEALAPGPHRTRHPPDEAAPVRPRLVMVPMLAFDDRGFRLGYGGGYYDRTLARLRAEGAIRAIGLAFAAQRVAALPVEAWDQPLDMIVTEQGLITVEQA